MSAPEPTTPPGPPPGADPGGVLTDRSWYRWHAPYDEIGSAQTDRLDAVQELIAEALDAAPPGPLKAVSVCAGQARDLLPMLITHPRGRDVAARMIELEPLNASFLHGALGSTDLEHVEVLVADAGLTDAYVGAVPADLVLISGPFAHIGRTDTLRTIRMLPRLCAPHAAVIWSTHGQALTDLSLVLDAFTTAGFTGASRTPDANAFAAGTHRLTVPPPAFTPGARMFTFPE
ncbi:hypothetical protein EDD29_4237 [Actinocorallia herbida]|uniref:Methyltransferase n=1 Tax=Actinocorallia herbida TaxID=58109 RepID=A0A3N1CZE8_9ACTN|nr:SAM-dependent methyltransferase [Actinocorallia herbida]ROO86660.1 hypothetical protein EDD29_4237 [Actinocorallia herbida]